MIRLIVGVGTYYMVSCFGYGVAVVFKGVIKVNVDARSRV